MGRYTKGKCQCGNWQTSAGRYKGRQIFHRYCKSCKNNKARTMNYIKKDFCESCGFVAQHKVQLDIDHINGDHSNNDPSNLQTICANCHRLKTYMNKDHMNNNWKSYDFAEIGSKSSRAYWDSVKEGK